MSLVEDRQALDTLLLLDDLRQGLRSLLEAVAGLSEAFRVIPAPLVVPAPIVEVESREIIPLDMAELASALEPLISSAPDPSVWLAPLEAKLTELVDRLKTEPPATVRGTGGTVRLAPDTTILATVPAGSATEAKQDDQVDQMTALLGRMPDLTGVFAYDATDEGTISVPTNGRVLSISVHTTVAATVTIDGGVDIPIPALTGFTEIPTAQLVGPLDIVGTGTDSMYVSWVI